MKMDGTVILVVVLILIALDLCGDWYLDRFNGMKAELTGGNIILTRK